MNRRTWFLAAGLVVLLAGWYWFRPEAILINRTVNEPLPAEAQAGGGGVELAKGTFRGLAHATQGTATVHRLASGERILRLTAFATSNGPDVRVLLVAAPDARDSDTVKRAGSSDLGALKGNRGDQNYDLPAVADLESYRAVTIWCRRFSVNFGTAPLSRTTGRVARAPR